MNEIDKNGKIVSQTVTQSLIQDLRQIIEQARGHVAATANYELTMMYWHIGEFIRGNGIQKSDFEEEGFSCIHYGQIHAKYGFSAEETISKIDEVLYKRCKKAKKGDVVLATTSEDAEGVAKPFVWLGEEDAAVSGDAFIYHHNQNGKFMGYLFLTHKFMQFKVKYATGAKVVRISGDNMAKYEVALPSLEKQNEIVSILDTFEASIQNLEAQLSQREKQYEYYRNKLLTF
jgi:type I restriction enzyme S subunit